MRLMNYLASATLALLLLAVPAVAQDTDEAVASAETWLALVDSEQYEQSWEASSDMLKEQVSAADWQQALQDVQTQLATFVGSAVDLSQRDLVMAERLEDMPQLPEGEYVMVRYRTSQEGHNFAEVVTLRDDAGDWRVVGYFVAPEEEQPGMGQ
jgi:hypothetical protein